MTGNSILIIQFQIPFSKIIIFDFFTRKWVGCGEGVCVSYKYLHLTGMIMWSDGGCPMFLGFKGRGIF